MKKAIPNIELAKNLFAAPLEHAVDQSKGHQSDVLNNVYFPRINRQFAYIIASNSGSEPEKALEIFKDYIKFKRLERYLDKQLDLNMITQMDGDVFVKQFQQDIGSSILFNRYLSLHSAIEKINIQDFQEDVKFLIDTLHVLLLDKKVKIIKGLNFSKARDIFIEHYKELLVLYFDCLSEMDANDKFSSEKIQKKIYEKIITFTELNKYAARFPGALDPSKINEYSGIHIHHHIHYFQMVSIWIVALATKLKKTSKKSSKPKEDPDTHVEFLIEIEDVDHTTYASNNNLVLALAKSIETLLIEINKNDSVASRIENLKNNHPNTLLYTVLEIIDNFREAEGFLNRVDEQIHNWQTNQSNSRENDISIILNYSIYKSVESIYRASIQSSTNRAFSEIDAPHDSDIAAGMVNVAISLLDQNQSFNSNSLDIISSMLIDMGYFVPMEEGGFKIILQPETRTVNFRIPSPFKNRHPRSDENNFKPNSFLDTLQEKVQDYINSHRLESTPISDDILNKENILSCLLTENFFVSRDLYMPNPEEGGDSQEGGDSEENGDSRQPNLPIVTPPATRLKDILTDRNSADSIKKKKAEKKIKDNEFFIRSSIRFLSDLKSYRKTISHIQPITPFLGNILKKYINTIFASYTFVYSKDIKGFLIQDDEFNTRDNGNQIANRIFDYLAMNLTLLSVEINKLSDSSILKETCVRAVNSQFRYLPYKRLTDKGVICINSELKEKLKAIDQNLQIKFHLLSSIFQRDLPQNVTFRNPTRFLAEENQSFYNRKILKSFIGQKKMLYYKNKPQNLVDYFHNSSIEIEDEDIEIKFDSSEAQVCTWDTELPVCVPEDLFQSLDYVQNLILEGITWRDIFSVDMLNISEALQLMRYIKTNIPDYQNSILSSAALRSHIYADIEEFFLPDPRFESRSYWDISDFDFNYFSNVSDLFIEMRNQVEDIDDKIRRKKTKIMNLTSRQGSVIRLRESNDSLIDRINKLYRGDPAPPVIGREYQNFYEFMTNPPQTQEPQTQEPQTQEPQTQEPQTQEPQTQEPQTQEPQRSSIFNPNLGIDQFFGTSNSDLFSLAIFKNRHYFELLERNCLELKSSILTTELFRERASFSELRKKKAEVFDLIFKSLYTIIKTLSQIKLNFKNDFGLDLDHELGEDFEESMTTFKRFYHNWGYLPKQPIETFGFVQLNPEHQSQTDPPLHPLDPAVLADEDNIPDFLTPARDAMLAQWEGPRNQSPRIPEILDFNGHIEMLIEGLDKIIQNLYTRDAVLSLPITHNPLESRSNLKETKIIRDLIAAFNYCHKMSRKIKENLDSSTGFFYYPYIDETRLEKALRLFKKLDKNINYEARPIPRARAFNPYAPTKQILDEITKRVQMFQRPRAGNDYTLLNDEAYFQQIENELHLFSRENIGYLNADLIGIAENAKNQITFLLNCGIKIEPIYEVFLKQIQRAHEKFKKMAENSSDLTYEEKICIKYLFENPAALEKYKSAFKRVFTRENEEFSEQNVISRLRGTKNSIFKKLESILKDLGDEEPIKSWIDSLRNPNNPNPTFKPFKDIYELLVSAASKLKKPLDKLLEPYANGFVAVQGFNALFYHKKYFNSFVLKSSQKKGDQSWYYLVREPELEDKIYIVQVLRHSIKKSNSTEVLEFQSSGDASTPPNLIETGADHQSGDRHQTARLREDPDTLFGIIVGFQVSKSNPIYSELHDWLIHMSGQPDGQKFIHTGLNDNSVQLPVVYHVSNLLRNIKRSKKYFPDQRYSIYTNLIRNYRYDSLFFKIKQFETLFDVISHNLTNKLQQFIGEYTRLKASLNTAQETQLQRFYKSEKGKFKALFDAIGSLPEFPNNFNYRSRRDTIENLLAFIKHLYEKFNLWNGARDSLFENKESNNKITKGRPQFIEEQEYWVYSTSVEEENGQNQLTQAKKLIVHTYQKLKKMTEPLFTSINYLEFSIHVFYLCVFFKKLAPDNIQLNQNWSIEQLVEQFLHLNRDHNPDLKADLKAQTTYEFGKKPILKHLSNTLQYMIQDNPQFIAKNIKGGKKPTIGYSNFGSAVMSIRLTPRGELWADIPYDVVGMKFHAKKIVSTGVDLGKRSLFVASSLCGTTAFNSSTSDNNIKKTIDSLQPNGKLIHHKAFAPLSKFQIDDFDRNSQKYYLTQISRTKSIQLSAHKAQKATAKNKARLDRELAVKAKKYKPLYRAEIRRRINHPDPKKAHRRSLHVSHCSAKAIEVTAKGAGFKFKDAISEQILTDFGISVPHENLTEELLSQYCQVNYENLRGFTEKKKRYKTGEVMQQWMHRSIPKHHIERSHAIGLKVYDEASARYSSQVPFYNPSVLGTTGFLIWEYASNQYLLIGSFEKPISEIHIKNRAGLIGHKKNCKYQDSELHLVYRSRLQSYFNDSNAILIDSNLKFYPSKFGNQLRYDSGTNTHHIIGRDDNASLNLAAYNIFLYYLNALNLNALKSGDSSLSERQYNYRQSLVVKFFTQFFEAFCKASPRIDQDEFRLDSFIRFISVHRSHMNSAIRRSLKHLENKNIPNYQDFLQFIQRISITNFEAERPYWPYALDIASSFEDSSYETLEDIAKKINALRTQLRGSEILQSHYTKELFEEVLGCIFEVEELMNPP